MKTAAQMKDEGVAPEEIEKALKEQGLDDAALSKALADLDALTKSEDESIDDLLKALEEQDALLAKSDDGDADDKGGDKDKGKESDSEDDDDEDEDEDMGKSLALEQELVKASEMYEELRTEVAKSMTSVDQKFDTLFKSVSASQNLLIKVASAVADIHGQQTGIQKSLTDIGANPIGGATGMFGVGQQGDPIKKSRNEIQTDLHKAVTEGRVPARFLSTFAVRGVDSLPPDVKKEIGIA